MKLKLPMTVLLVSVLAIITVMPVSADSSCSISKFYDSNANGLYDQGDEYMEGWLVNVNGVPYCTKVPPGTVVFPSGITTISEYDPIQTNWMATTPKTIVLHLEDKWTSHDFGNVCLGPGGGLTPGYWSNKNGQTSFNTVIQTRLALEALTNLNLWTYNKKTGIASEFNPQSYAGFKAWLQARDAVDMRYQLSAHLAAMKLNVIAGFVDEDALVYINPAIGYKSIGDLTSMANDALGDSSSTRDYLEQLKNALDNANNNKNFVQSEPCPYTFAEATCPLTGMQVSGDSQIAAPEFPTMFLPATMIIGMLGAVLLIQKTRKN